MVITLLDTGLRVSEFCNLKASDVRWQEDFISVKGAKRRRRVPLTERVKKLLEWQFAAEPNAAMNIPKTTAEEIVARVAARAMLVKKCTPHVLRHTFCVNALRRGVDLRSVQLAAGHSDIRVTEHYLGYLETEPPNAFRRVDW